MRVDELLDVLRALDAEEVEYVLVGATALNVHGIVRATEDIDLFVRPTAENIERLRSALQAVYDDPDIEEISTEDLLGEYPAVRYYPPEGELFLDILTRLGSFAGYDDLEVETVEFEGLPVRVASPRALYRLKKDTLREIDRMDAELLRRRFDLEEE